MGFRVAVDSKPSRENVKPPIGPDVQSRQAQSYNAIYAVDRSASRRDMTEETGTPLPERLLLSTRKEYLEAMEQVFALAQRELRIFDADFFHLKIDAPYRQDLLRRFLLR